MSPSKMISLVVLFGAMLFANAALFTINEGETAIRFAVGKFDKSNYEPGLHWKLPMYHRIVKFDKRILTYDAPEERYLTKDGNPLIVDYYIKWRISDVELYYQKVRGRELNAINRFNPIVNKGLSDEFGKHSEWEVISKERKAIMDKITIAAREQVKDFGIEIVDVRTKRIELPRGTFQKIFDRMRSERLKEANERRASGIGEGDQIRAAAEKERKIMLADGYSQSQVIRGEGDATSAKTYAQAYNKDAEFYSFYRSLDAYKKSFGSENNLMVLEPSSDFFKYFKKSK